jgi:hypothetical protein
MPLVDKVIYVREPTDLQCGQAVLSMLSGLSVDEIIALCGTDRETNLKQMLSVLDALEIKYIRERRQAQTKDDLPKICVLSLETPRCWHWSLYFDGTFYDPEHGVMNDFPECKRKYYWEILP